VENPKVQYQLLGKYQTSKEMVVGI